MSMLRTLRGDASSYSSIRLSICVPCRDMMHSASAFSLCKMVEYNGMMGIGTQVHFNMGTLLVNQREGLVDMARDAGATHILWIDSDMIFPSDTAQRLLGHKRDVVAGNYVTRQYPHKTVAYSRFNDWNSYLTHDPDCNDVLTKVDAVGMGCMLMKMSVFDQLSKPYFQTQWVPETNDHMGEDFTLCAKLKMIGCDVLIDNDLSRSLQHLGTFAFTHNMVQPLQG